MTNEKSYVNMEPSNPVQTVAPDKEETYLREPLKTTLISKSSDTQVDG